MIFPKTNHFTIISKPVNVFLLNRKKIQIPYNEPQGPAMLTATYTLFIPIYPHIIIATYDQYHNISKILCHKNSLKTGSALFDLGWPHLHLQDSLATCDIQATQRNSREPTGWCQWVDPMRRNIGHGIHCFLHKQGNIFLESKKMPKKENLLSKLISIHF